MKNTPMHSHEQGTNKDKCEFKNLAFVDMTPANSKINTDRISNNENRIIINESLNVPENSPLTVSLNKKKQFSILSTDEALIDIAVVKGDQRDISDTSDILRLFIKNGEFVYAHPRDIIMIESCDHLVCMMYLFHYGRARKTYKSNHQ